MLLSMALAQCKMQERDGVERPIAHASKTLTNTQKALLANRKRGSINPRNNQILSIPKWKQVHFGHGP